MYKNKIFNADSLKLCVWQPVIIHNIIDFEVGDRVYLNSNPEYIMVIEEISYTNDIIHTNKCSLPPHCLQLENDISFRRYKRTEFIINLN